MRRNGITRPVLILAFLFSAVSIFSDPLHAAWRQTDWSGGPGQSLWQNPARYDNSDRLDTMNRPGFVSLSFLTSPLTKEATNPVLAAGLPGSWDSNFAFNWPGKREGGGYEVLYQGVSAANIMALGYAGSDNGVVWTKHAGNPVLGASGSTWDPGGVGIGPLLKEGNLNTLFFREVHPTVFARYGQATSTDLRTWVRTPTPVFEPGPAGSWDERIMNIVVRRIGTQYRMWYSGIHIATGNMMVGYASSPDGITWTRNLAPVFEPGTPGSWDDRSINIFSILERPWRGDLMMVYLGMHVGGGSGVGIATSPDGLTWTRDPGNPVLSPGGPGTWNEGSFVPVHIAFDGSIYRMILTGTNTAPIPKTQSGEAWCFEGSGTWVVNFSNPILRPGTLPGDWDVHSVRAGLPHLEGDNTLRVFFGGDNGASPTRLFMGTATGFPRYASNGRMESSVFDSGPPRAVWGQVSWTETVPAGTTLTVQVRGGETPVPDGTWTAWTPVTNGGTVPHPPSRYLQYRVELTRPGSEASPVFSNLTVAYQIPIYLPLVVR